jgi:hypothetical protein
VSRRSVNVQEAISEINRGSGVFICAGCVEPQRPIEAVVKDPSLQDILVYQMFSKILAEYVDDKSFLDRFPLKLFFISNVMRKAAFAGKTDCVSAYLPQIPRLFANHRRSHADRRFPAPSVSQRDTQVLRENQLNVNETMGKSG